MVNSFGVKSSACNGNNALECYDSISKAFKYVKSKSKPFFLECKTYRHLEHCGPNNDDNLNYRPTSQIKYWRRNDPILNINKVVHKKFSKTKLITIENKLKKEIEAAFNFAKKSKFPSEIEAFKGNYA